MVIVVIVGIQELVDSQELQVVQADLVLVVTVGIQVLKVIKVLLDIPDQKAIKVVKDIPDQKAIKVLLDLLVPLDLLGQLVQPVALALLVVKELVDSQVTQV